jgi:uncharacterized repeat protein (TIGR02543 family)
VTYVTIGESDMTYYAEYYNITGSGSGSGSGSGNDEPQYTITFKSYVDGSIIYQETGTTGTEVEIPTPPTIDGQIFDCWSIEGGEDLSDDVTHVTIGESDMTYYANYATEYTITFKSDIDQSTIYQETGTMGTVVEIPTTPTYDGYTFSHWYNSEGRQLSNDVTYVTIGERDMTYYACYTENTGSGSGSGSGNDNDEQQ